MKFFSVDVGDEDVARGGDIVPIDYIGARRLGEGLCRAERSNFIGRQRSTFEKV